MRPKEAAADSWSLCTFSKKCRSGLKTTWLVLVPLGPCSNILWQVLCGCAHAAGFSMCMGARSRVEAVRQRHQGSPVLQVAGQQVT